MPEIFRTLQEWLDFLAWSQRKLARVAGLDAHTVGKAVSGDDIAPETAVKIAKALSEGSGQAVFPGDIRGLVIRR